MFRRQSVKLGTTIIWLSTIENGEKEEVEVIDHHKSRDLPRFFFGDKIMKIWIFFLGDCNGQKEDKHPFVFIQGAKDGLEIVD